VKELRGTSPCVAMDGRTTELGQRRRGKTAAVELSGAVAEGTKEVSWSRK
jgi:hypothetical protein